MVNLGCIFYKKFYIRSELKILVYDMQNRFEFNNFRLLSVN
jgi:hypothetical protein